MQVQIFLFLSVILNLVSLDTRTDEDIEEIQREFGNFDFEPISNTKYNEKLSIAKNIDCDNFTGYATKCRLDAARIYNSSRMSPPTPLKINDWCKAIKHLSNCAMDWNSDCKEVTDSHFNVETTKGHIHVVDNICDNYYFLTRYEESLICIENATDPWESCYITFNDVIETQKSSSYGWTHYKVHFLLCCARARFRRCTLDLLFVSTSQCTHEQAVILQKFSVIVSEGAVFQDCDHNMLYENCPDGDPRPSKKLFSQLMSGDPKSGDPKSGAARTSIQLYICFVLFCLQ